MHPDPRTPHDAHAAGHRDEPSHVPIRSSPGTGRNIAVFALVLAVALCAAFAWRHHRRAVARLDLEGEAAGAADAPPPVDVVRVGYADRTDVLDLPGEARAWYESTIYARVSGYIGKWSADIGAKVTRGQILAEIQTPELDDQLRAAQARVASDKSLVAVAEANAVFARSANARWASSPKGVVSLQAQEEKKAEFLSASAKLKAAQSQVDLDQAEVNRLEDLANFKMVRAPYDGVITTRRIDIGDLVTAGSTTGNTPLYDVVQSDKIRVFVDVPQAASAQIVTGMPAVANAHEQGAHKFVGKVARTSESIDSAARTLKVEVDIDNPDLAIKPGMYLDVSFRTDTAHPPLRIPAGALAFRSAGPQAAVVDSSGVVHFRDVAIARDLGSYVEIASGVADGDLVALNISNQIADGDKVQTHVEPATPGVAPAGSTPHVALSAQPR